MSLDLNLSEFKQTEEGGLGEFKWTQLEPRRPIVALDWIGWALGRT